MLTYVINTSENKTFDSSTLFELTGYNKIRWLHSSIDEITSCAESICEKQNVLGAEDFRVAVIVDFYNFDKIRMPYGRRGFIEDEGVDLSVYMPYIEAYLLDNLVVYLEKKELYASDFEIYYVLNEKSERFELFDNARGQLEQILKGDEPAAVYTTEEMRARRAAEKAVKRIVHSSKKENSYPNLEEIKCRPTDKWERFNMTWQNSNVVVSMPIADRWSIRDFEPNEHLIFSDGAEIGRVVIEEYDNVAKKVMSKSFEIGDVTLNYDLRIIEQGAEFIYRYAFAFSFTDKDRENRVIIEINYDEIDKDALEYILKEIIVSTKDDRNFDGKFMQVNDVFYKSFTLHCTPDVSLKFLLTDYPYGAVEMTFAQFWKAFRDRQAIKTDMRRHYYVVPYGGGSSRAALDTLSLSLYLIRMYEREELTNTEGDMEVFRLDSEVLKEVLESAWSKVNTAKGIAKSSSLKYYALSQFDSDTDETVKEESVEELLFKERYQVIKNMNDDRDEKGLSAEAYYEKINEIADRRLDALTEKNRHDFDKVMTEYLLKRDATKEANSQEEFAELKNSNLLKTTDKCPTKEEYNYLVGVKKRKISALFEKALSSEYIDVSYEEESKKADEAYKEYTKAKACLNRNIVGDVIFMILTLAMFIVPYILMQLTGFDSKVISSTALAFNMTGIFAGLFVLAFLIQMIPLVGKMNVCKRILKNCYIDCRAKESYAFSAIRRKYEKDLISIEQARYDVRQLKHIFDANIAKEKNVAHHREMLEKLEDCLSSILNNLDVEPRVSLDEAVLEMIDLNKPVDDRSNSIYQVFSIETIEKMFPKKGRD